MFTEKRSKNRDQSKLVTFDNEEKRLDDSKGVTPEPCLTKASPVFFLNPKQLSRGQC